MIPPGYHLVWQDEFRQDGRPSSANWTYETGFIRNEELQLYQPQNATVKHHLLVIEGRRETVKNPNYSPGVTDWQRSRQSADYTSACLTTRGLHEWMYGRVEVCAKIDPQDGLWPAIWTMGSTGEWPKCGEVDILEYYRRTILANTCYGERVWNSVRTPYAQFTSKDPHWAEKFHVWRMDWSADSIDLFLDGERLNHTDTRKSLNPEGDNAFHRPQYLLLNLAIGSTGGDPSHARFPSRFEIKSVRVYQKD